MRRSSWNGRHLVRLVWVALGLGIAVLACLFLMPWLPMILTRRITQAAVIGFLISLELAYGAVLVAAVIGVAVFSGILSSTRRGGRGRSLGARGLLLCLCCLVGLALAEMGAAARRASMHKARSPKGDPALPLHFAGATQDGEVTLVVLGESSAFGMPFETWFSVGHIVAWQLGLAIPERRFRVEMLAMPGDTLEGQHHKLAGLSHKPDALIVYCGHNEFAAHISYSRKVDHYADDRPSALLWGLDDFAVRASPLCALIRETADKFRVGEVPPFDLHPPLVDWPAYTPAEFAANLADFGRRLEAMTVYAGRVGAIPILVIPPANDARFDPNRSFLTGETTRAERTAFAHDFQAARALEDSDWTQAMEAYRALLARQPGFAETHYRMACLLEEAGAWDEAYRHYVAARDLDGLPMRCLTPFQDAYRQVAERHDSILVDGQSLFHAIGQHGLLEDHLFHDGMHPSLLGHIALAQGILEALHDRRAFGWSSDAPAPTIDPARCAAHFGLEPKDWKRLAERGSMFYYGTASLRYDPRQRRDKQRAFQAASQRIEAGEAAETIGLPNVGIPHTRPARVSSKTRSAVSGPSQPSFK